MAYNSYTDSFALMSHKAYEAYKTENVSEFAKQFPDIYRKFEDMKFIIDDEIDEIARFRFDNRKATFKSETRFLMVYPTQNCNCKCWYCYENHIESKMHPNVIGSICKYVEKGIERKEFNTLHLTFFGGEPFMYFDDCVLPILKNIKEICDKYNIIFHCFFITNASLINEDIVVALKPYNPMFQITLDGDEHKHDKVRMEKTNNAPTYRRIIDALHYISKHITKKNHNVSNIVTIRINYDNQTLKNVDNIIADILDLDKSNFHVHLERVWQTSDSITSEQNTLLKEAIVKFAQAGFRVGCSTFGPRMHSCPAEVYDYAVINYNGLVYRCNGRNLTPETAEGRLLANGDIEWNEAKLHQRLSRATYENDKCLKCPMLPQCIGPCSQKQMEKGWGNIDDVCTINNLDTSLEEYLTLMFEIRNYLSQVSK